MPETITVVGNITEPDFKTTTGGVPILNFRIASTERRFDKTEQKWVDGATSWYSVSAFRSLAEHGARSLRKGDRVVVTGGLRLRDWETTAKRGVTAEIDADALGHDLLWGTTTFHRGGGAQRPESPADQWAVPGAQGDPAAAAESWAVTAVPDATTGLAGEDAGGDAVSDQRELVGATADTPF